MTERRRELGRAGEDAAASFLAARGWTILARNVRVERGEVDIVARRDATLAFIEVKTRRSRAFGDPAEAVTHRKQQRIRRCAQALLAQGLHAPRIRFDVVEVTARGETLSLRHLEGAF